MEIYWLLQITCITNLSFVNGTVWYILLKELKGLTWFSPVEELFCFVHSFKSLIISFRSLHFSFFLSVCILCSFLRTFFRRLIVPAFLLLSSFVFSFTFFLSFLSDFLSFFLPSFFSSVFQDYAVVLIFWLTQKNVSLCNDQYWAGRPGDYTAWKKL